MVRSRTRLYSIVAVILIVILDERVHFWVRPQLVASDPEWYHLLVGTAPNILFGIGLPFSFLAFYPAAQRRDYLVHCASMLFLLWVYEGVQLLLPGKTFDPADLLASVLGVGISACLGLKLMTGQFNAT